MLSAQSDKSFFLKFCDFEQKFIFGGLGEPGKCSLTTESRAFGG